MEKTPHSESSTPPAIVMRGPDQYDLSETQGDLDFKIMVEPVTITWAYLAGVFLTSLATKAGEKVGERLGEELMNAILGGKNPATVSPAFITEQLDNFYARIASFIRSAIRDDTATTLHGQTSAQMINFKEFVYSYKTHYDKLRDYDREVNTLFEVTAAHANPKSLVGLVNLGALRITYGMEWLARTRRRDDARNALERIKHVMLVVSMLVDKAEKLNNSRVTGGHYEKRLLSCPARPDYGRGGGGGGRRVDLSLMVTDEGLANADTDLKQFVSELPEFKIQSKEQFFRIAMVDGHPYEFPDIDCSGPVHEDPTAACAKFMKQKSDEFAAAFNTEVKNPFISLKRKADTLAKVLQKYA